MHAERLMCGRNERGPNFLGATVWLFLRCQTQWVPAPCTQLVFCLVYISKRKPLSNDVSVALLQWLVALQGFLTLVGNISLWAGSLHVFKQAQASSNSLE
jgi:hypothetical protein